MKNKLPTTTQIRQRLIYIIDDYIKTIQDKKLPNHVITLNQGLLQQWTDLLSNLLQLKDLKNKPIQSIQTTSNKQKLIIKNIIPPLIENKQQQKDKKLITIQKNTLTLWSINANQSTNQKLTFQKGYVHQYSSYIIDGDSAWLIGGCRNSNPNLKSKSIMNFNIISKQIKRATQMPFGLSSHASIKINNIIYIIGGNIDHNIPSKRCLSFNLQTLNIKIINNLNYASASHCVVNWQDKYIFKFGGVGNCFSSYDISPYIQQYNIEEDSWSIVNPKLQIKQNLLAHYSLLTRSFAYCSQDGRIVVMGGCNIDNKPSSFCFSLTIPQDPLDIDSYTINDLFNVRDLIPGIFYNQQYQYDNRCLVLLETIFSNKNQPLEKIVYLNDKIKYT